MTYLEYLKSLGIDDATASTMNRPEVASAWEKQQAEVATLSTKAQKAEADRAAYQKWYDEQAQPAFTRMQADLAKAQSDAAAERARLKSLQEQGLLAVAEATDPGSTQPKAGETPAFDPAKYNLVTQDTLLQVADREGDAIAIMADILQEHSELFPGQRITARELRKEAVAQKKSVEQVWLEKYNVPAKRAEKQAADKAAYEKKIADEAVAKYRSENLNPNTAAAAPSRNPFTAVVQRESANGGRATMPWDRNENDSANSRVNKALKNLPI